MDAQTQIVDFLPLPGPQELPEKAEPDLSPGLPAAHLIGKAPNRVQGAGSACAESPGSITACLVSHEFGAPSSLLPSRCRQNLAWISVAQGHPGVPTALSTAESIFSPLLPVPPRLEQF